MEYLKDKIELETNSKVKKLRSCIDSSVTLRRFPWLDKDNYILQISLLLTDLNNWFQSNLLNLNPNKTNYVEFKPTKWLGEDIQLKCDDTFILTNTHTKFLGLILDNTLSWNSHIDSLIRKMSSACYALSQRFSNCGPCTTSGPPVLPLWSF